MGDVMSDWKWEMDTLVSKDDEVGSPAHYKIYPGKEVIDIIKEVLTEEEFRGYCIGNSLKYRLRAGKKGDLTTDIKKAEQYEGWL